jgi:uncharacterized protein (TIGR01777 family)
MGRVRVVSRELPLRHPAEAVFAWHLRPGAFERLQPSWLPVRVTARRGGVADGGEVDLSVPILGPLRQAWTARHEGVIPGREFRDRQVRGPFREWLHIHRVRPEGDGCVLEDQIEYALPGGALGRWLAQDRVEATLARVWAHRHRRLRHDLDRHASVRGRGPLRVAISGANGLLGSALGNFLSSGGHRVQRLVRGRAGPDDIAWDPGRSVDLAALDGCDALVHLAGRSVSERWTPVVKAEILRSRVEATAHLAAALAGLAHPPRTVICASAIGIYGNRGDEPLKEDSALGDGFLADVCRAWEAACAPARAAGLRVVHARLGVVVAASGGALAKMLPAARCGLAGPIGGGKQWMSWIGLDDAIGALHHLLFAEDLAGPVDLVAPEPVTNAAFMRTLGRVLRRPAAVPVPRAAIEALFGDMGRETMLSSVRVLPARLLAQGFSFLQPDLATALRCELGK